MTFENEFHGPNLAYILELYEKYRSDPNSVDVATRKLFEQWSPNEIAIPVLPQFGQAPQNLLSITGAANLAQAIRVYGYLSANLNPLESPPVPASIPLLTPEFHHIREEDLPNLPADIVNLPEGK